LFFVFEVGGPSRVQPRPFTADKALSDEDVEAAIAVLKHSADEDTIREKMKATFIFRQSMVNTEKSRLGVLSLPKISRHTRCKTSPVFKNEKAAKLSFLKNGPQMWASHMQCVSTLLSMHCIFALQMEQDFRLLIGEATANKFLEKWPSTLKRKVITESKPWTSTDHRALGFNAQC